jgi:DNA-binding transcriptional ArsR family regulator
MVGRTEKVAASLAADCLAALGNATRLEVFRLLVRAGPKGLTVGEVQRHVAIPGSTLSHHLDALARTGLVLQERRGREVVCRPDYPRMRGIIAFLTDQCCAGVAKASSAA